MGEAIGPAEGRDRTRRQAPVTSHRQPTLWPDGRRWWRVTADAETSDEEEKTFRAVALQGEL
jgi:hypothetical protein